jgi:hypothetical protein
MLNITHFVTITSAQYLFFNVSTFKFMVIIAMKAVKVKAILMPFSVFSILSI